MISKKTIFVVGAGASKPFGLPTGAELIDALIETPMVPHTPPPLGFEDEEWTAPRSHLELGERLSQLLKNAHLPSIDAFLFHYREDHQLVKYGKRALASRLIAKENAESLISAKINVHWLRSLWDAMRGTGSREFQFNNVAFVVFNYDRCIEHYFTTVLSNTHRLTPSDAHSVLSSLQIIHPHGMLAPYSPSPCGVVSPYTGNRTRQETRQYESEVSYDSVELAAQHLTLFWEEKKEGVESDSQLQRLLADAKRIVFLGFGFLENNLRPLCDNIECNSSNVELFGTCLGLSRKACASVRDQLPAISLHDVDCRTLLHEHVPLD